MKFSVYYKVKKRDRWKLWSSGVDEDTAGFQCVELLMSGDAVSVKIEETK